VNVNTAPFFLGSFHEIDDFIEAALDILPHMIFEMEGQILDAVLLAIVSAIVSGTVDDVSDTIFLQFF